MYAGIGPTSTILSMIMVHAGHSYMYQKYKLQDGRGAKEGADVLLKSREREIKTGDSLAIEACGIRAGFVFGQ